MKSSSFEIEFLRFMDNCLDIQIEETLKTYLVSGVEDQVAYQKFYLYSIVTHSSD